MQAEVYNTMVNYVKTLKKPLNTSIEKIAGIVSDDPDAAVATKTIQVAKQHIDMLMNKIEAYPKPIDPKQETES